MQTVQTMPVLQTVQTMQTVQTPHDAALSSPFPGAAFPAPPTAPPTAPPRHPATSGCRGGASGGPRGDATIARALAARAASTSPCGATTSPCGTPSRDAAARRGDASSEQHGVGRAGGEAGGEAEPLVAMPLTLNRGGDANQAEEVHLRVHSGQDLSQQVFRFCAANNLHSADQVLLSSQPGLGLDEQPTR